MPRKRTHGGRRKGAGRPREPGAHSARLVVRVRPELLDWIEALAAERNMAVPEYVRLLLWDAAQNAACNHANGVAGKRKAKPAKAGEAKEGT